MMSIVLGVRRSPCGLFYLPRDPQCLADDLIRVSPLVVVSAHHLEQITIDNPGQTEIHNRCSTISDDVGRDDRIRGHTEPPR